MPLHRTWREKAAKVIGYELVAWLAANGLDEFPPSLSPEQAKSLLKAIADAYPFGEREAYPYAAWLKEVGLLKARLGLKEPQTRAEREARWVFEHQGETELTLR